MPQGPLAYRDFTYPLNVFMHILTHEEGSVHYLHYGLFQSADEPLLRAQERSTDILLARLPPPPARLLEVGIGLGTTLQRLAGIGYRMTGITPDEHQVAMARERVGRHADVRCIAFQDFPAGESFDTVFFQESSQYIPSAALFAKAGSLTSHVLVLDEFSMTAAGTLHNYGEFLRAAAEQGFRLHEEVDLSAQAPPTIGYFMNRIPRYRDRLVEDLQLTSQQVDDLLVSGRQYTDFYRDGVYSYRLAQFRR